MNAPTIIHDAFGLSKAERWLSCPGSVNRSRGIPDAPGDAAQRGSRIHDLCQLIADKKEPPPEADGEELALAIALVRHGEALASHYGATSDTPSATEIPQDVSCLGIERDGHIDRLWILEDKVIVLDYKTGKVQVNAEQNPQLAGYAVAAAEECGVSSAVCIIVQPDMDDGAIHGSAWEMDEDELSAWKALLRTGKRIAEKSTALVPGSHCRYCPAAPECEARAGIMHQVLSTAQADIYTLLEGMDDLQRGDLIARLTEGIAWATALLDATKEHLQVTGLQATGYKWKKGASTRIWSDPVLAERTLLAYAATAGIPDESIREVKLKSPAALEKEKQVPTEIFAELIGTKENRPSLVADKSKKKGEALC